MIHAYVLMSYKRSPLFITHPKAVATYDSRKSAKEEAKKRNESKRTSLIYYVVTVPFISSEI